MGTAAATALNGPTLVVGASGAVGGALLRALAARGTPVIAWSRSAKKGVRVTYPQMSDSDPLFSWQTGELFTDVLPEVDAILSAGPIDGLVAAFSRSPACMPRVVIALSSSSAAFKRDSMDAQERALAARLASSEAALAELCRTRGTRCVILRPTLIYGGSDAASLGAIEALARRFGFIALPRSAFGLRMPIHAGDLAATMLGALRATAASGTFAVGGGETLAYDAMLERVLRARDLPLRIVRIPDRVFRVLLKCAHVVGLLRGLTDAVVLRMCDDLVVDDAPARHALGHAPGPFRPGGTL